MLVGETVPNAFDELNELEIKLQSTLKKLEQKKNELLKKQKDQKLCLICTEKEKCVAFTPCGHMCSCDGCSTQLGQCPMCRQPIQNRIKIFT